MAKLINLGRERKRVARVKQDKQSEANRAKFGRTRLERMRDEKQTALAETTLDQLRLTERDEP